MDRIFSRPCCKSACYSLVLSGPGTEALIPTSALSSKTRMHCNGGSKRRGLTRSLKASVPHSMLAAPTELCKLMQGTPSAVSSACSLQHKLLLQAILRSTATHYYWFFRSEHADESSAKLSRQGLVHLLVIKSCHKKGLNLGPPHRGYPIESKFSPPVVCKSP